MIILEVALARLSANVETIAALARGISDDQVRWRPAPDAWSVLEVLCHLLDEEREDFRTRLRLTLEHPETDWPPIDPTGWILARGYNQREPRLTLDALLGERRASVEWLRSLANANWASAHQHPNIGTMTAAEVLGAWVVHDHLHIRQLNELHWQYVSRRLTALSLDYAGGW
jgi:hypothetical protein